MADAPDIKMKDEESKDNFSLRRPSQIHSSISGILPGLILILIGIIFLLNYYGLLQGEWWQYFLVGLGVVFLVEAWIQYINPFTGKPRFGRIAAGLALIVIGIIFLFDPTKWWPLILIFIGIILIIQYILRIRALNRNNS